MVRQITSLLIRLGRSIVPFFLLLTPTLTSAQSIPPTLGWYQIPNTNLRSVCPPNNFGGSGYEFYDQCQSVTGAWNSAVFDTARNRLIIWGGGHNDYYGNEIYALNLNTVTIQRITDPGLPLGSSRTCQESIAGGSQPNSRHTYDGIVYMPNVDRMFVFGGSLACGGGWFSTGTWAFDFTSMKWQKMNSTGTNPSAVPGVVTAYDPNSGKVFLHDDKYLYSYNFSTNKYQRLSGSNPIDYHMTAVIDPIRKTFIIVGAGSVYSYDIGSRFSYTRRTLKTTGGSAIVNSDYPGLAYDPVSGRIVAWNGGNTVYSLNLDTKAWTATTYSGGPGSGLRTGTYKRWNYSPTSGVFVVLNSVDSGAYTFRLTSGSPDTDPPVPPSKLTAPD
jgi:hypothetical protein